jgi:hypothetical protein
MPGGEQPAGQVETEEAGPAGDRDAHRPGTVAA